MERKNNFCIKIENENYNLCFETITKYEDKTMRNTNILIPLTEKELVNVYKEIEYIITQKGLDF